MSFPPPTPKQARVLWFSLTTLTLTIIVGLVALGLGWLLKRLSAVLLPVALALVLAYILDPLVELLVRKKIPRIWSILLVFLIGIIICTGLISSVVPDLLKESQKLVQVLNAKDIHKQVKDFLKTNTLLKQVVNWSGISTPAKSPHESASNPAPAKTLSPAAPTNSTQRD